MSEILNINLEQGMNSYIKDDVLGNRLMSAYGIYEKGLWKVKNLPYELYDIPYDVTSVNWLIIDGSLEYVFYDSTTGKIIQANSDFSSFTELFDIPDSSKPSRLDLSNWGSEMRIACGYVEEPKILMHISNRKFFNNSWTYDGDYFDTKAFPRKPSTWIYRDHDTDGVSGELQSGGSITEGKSCFYKIIPIFDGLQEMNLDDSFYGPIVTTSGNQSVKLELDVDSNTSDWNPRITGCRIYRSTTDGNVPKKSEYRNIRTIDFIKESPASWITSSSAYKGRKIYAHSLSADYSTFPATGKWGEAQNTYPSASTIGTEGTFTKASDKFLFLGEDRESSDQWGDSLTTYLWGPSASGVTSADITVPGGSASQTRTDTITKPANVDNLRVGMTVFYSTVTPDATEFVVGDFKILRDTDGDGSYETTFYDTSVSGPNTTTTTGTDPCFVSKKGYPASSGSETQYATIDISGIDDSETFQIQWEVWDVGSISTIKSTMQFAEFFVGSHTTAYSHQSILAIADSGIADNSAVGKTLQVGGSDYFIDVNQGDIFRVSGNAGWIDASSTSGNTVSGGDLVFSNPAGTTQRMTFVDVGEVESSYHPFSGVDSLDTRFKYSTSLNGRQFVANVTIYDGMSAEGEEHNDMVIFSELNAPDVLPISNFIQVKDLQGGQIYGIEGLFSDVVIFSERGIFRLNIPSDDPTSWSLVESEPNIGCIDPQSIVKWEGGVFFKGTNNFYYITPNFEFIPVGNDLQTSFKYNQYLEFFSYLDLNLKKLVIHNQWSYTTDLVFIFDLQKFKINGETFWSLSESLNSSSQKKCRGFTNREGEFIFTARDTNGDSSYDNTKIYRWYGSSAGEKMFFSTGWIDIDPLTKKGQKIIRRIFLDFGGAGTPLLLTNCTINIYTNDDNVPVFAKEIDLTTDDCKDGESWCRSFRVGVRATKLRVYVQNIPRISRMQIEVD